MQTIQASYIFHRNEQRIRLLFENYGPLNKLIKSIRGARWSKTYKSWHIPRNKTLYNSFKNNLPDGCHLTEVKEAVSKLTKMPVENLAQLPEMPNTNNRVQKIKQPAIVLNNYNREAHKNLIKTLTLKFYSGSTKKTYSNEFGAFLQVIKNISADSITPEQMQRYILYCINTLKLSENTIHSRMNALKFYYEQVLHREKMFFDIPRPKKPILLPKLLNETELGKLFNALSNKKHKAMLFTAYSAGLRVSEIVNVKLADIDSKRMQILISRAKGKKRQVCKFKPCAVGYFKKVYIGV